MLGPTWIKNRLFFMILGLGGLKLDEIDATNSFLMLLMARYSLKWPLEAHFRPNLQNLVATGPRRA